ncbi:MAG: hypothetical protein ACOYMA_03985 [Bacteroidia bacterium]
MKHMRKVKEIYNLFNADAKDLIGSFASKESDIIFLLGQPELKISNSVYQYSMGDEKSKSKVIIEFNKERRVIFSAIKNIL